MYQINIACSALNCLFNTAITLAQFYKIISMAKEFFVNETDEMIAISCDDDTIVNN